MSTVKLDTLYSHSKNVGSPSPEARVGEFCGSPIVTLDQRAIDIDNLLEADRMIEIDKGFESETVNLNILPGEIICADGVIRRGTAAEVVGEQFYEFEVPKDTTKVGINVARLASLAGKLVFFSPDGKVGEREFALVYE